MDEFSQSQYIGILIGLTLALVALLLVLRSRQKKSLDAILRAASRDVLKNFVIPDGNGGEIQIQYALLTPSRVLVLDFKDVAGHVFGSNAMQDWTVISDKRRFTFSNPQPALYDRVAAVKRLVPNLPVRGFIVFPSRAKFTKGQPSEVTILRDLIADLEAETKSKKPAEDIAHLWARLRHEAVSTQFGQLLRD